jgi:hypothetical protein
LMKRNGQYARLYQLGLHSQPTESA